MAILAILAIMSGLICCFLGYLFFRYLPAWVLSQFGHGVSVATARIIRALGMVALFSSGFLIWRKKGGLQSYEESAFYFESLARGESGGVYAVNH